MKVDIEELAKYPMESDDWVTTVLLGGLATIFSFLILPIFLVSGYLVRALRAGMENDSEPPTFDDWGKLFTEGFVAAVIGFIYQLVPLVVFFVFVGGSILAFLTGTDAGGIAGLAGIFGGLFVSWILAIVFGVVGLAGVANYAREGRFGAGFDFGLIVDVVTDRSYLLAWGYVIVLNIVVGFVVAALNIIPFLGTLVGVFLTFYALIIAGWLWGQGFAEAVGDGEFPSTDADTREQERWGHDTDP